MKEKLLTKKEILKKYQSDIELYKNKGKKKDFSYYVNLLKRDRREKKEIKDFKNKKEKEIKLKRKIEQKDLFNGFNKINGYIPKYNLVVNELNDYIKIIECFDYDGVKDLINNMNNYSIKEIQVFTHGKRIYCSLRFENNFKNIVKNKNNAQSVVSKQEEELKNIDGFLNNLKKEDTKFRLLSLLEMFKIIRDKVFREDELTDKEINEIILNKKHNKNDFQTKINAKKVNIDNDYIKFNYEENNENIDNNIYHKVFGLQLYPSYLYEGYLSEINYLSGVQTCTYIQKIDRLKVKNSLKDIKTGQLLIVKDYIEKVQNLYLTCFFIHIYGSKEKVEDIKRKIINISNKYNVHLNEFNKQQKRAYDAFLPLMNNKIKCYRQIDNISGILPENADLIKNFKCNFLYGKELNSDNNFYYKRQNSGVILSTNNAIKDLFISKEKTWMKDQDKKVIEFNFFLKNIEEKNNITNIEKMFFNKDFSNITLNEYQIYVLFKIWLNLCLSYYKDKNYIDKNDKENLDAAFSLLEQQFMFDENGNRLYGKNLILSMTKNKIIYNNTNLNLGFIDRILNYIKVHNDKLYDHIIEKYNKPNKELKLLINEIYNLINTTCKNGEYKNYAFYISNSQEIIYALDIIFDFFFTNKFENTYLFSSNNDFLLLNNSYVSKSMFLSKYINMLDVASSDLVKINDYVYLSNADITHLNNKVNISGRLITDICEFNYYIEKVHKENII